MNKWPAISLAWLTLLLLLPIAEITTHAANAGERILFSIAGYDVFIAARTPNDGLSEERVIVRAAKKSKPLYASSWGHVTQVAAYARTGVVADFLQPDITGDGHPKLYVWVYEGNQDYFASLTVLKLGASIEKIAALPPSPGEGPKIEKTESGDAALISVEEFVPLIEGQAVDLPTTTLQLQWTNGAFHLVPKTMVPPVPSKSAQQSQAKQLQHLFDKPATEKLNPNGEPWELWKTAANWAWSGDETSALQLIEHAWPPGRKGLKKRKAEFLKALQSNPWYREVKFTQTKSEKVDAQRKGVIKVKGSLLTFDTSLVLFVLWVRFGFRQ